MPSPLRFALVAGAFAVASCGGDEGPRSTGDDGRTAVEIDHRVAVAADSARPPGSELAPDVVVQDGSSLVGHSVPVVAEWDDSPPVGWQALLIVDGDPLDVWDLYADQLDLGEAGRAVNSCRVLATKPLALPNGGPRPERPLTEDPVEGEDRLECGVTTETTSMVMAVGAATCSPGDALPCGERAVAHLYIVASDPLVLLDAEPRRPTQPVPVGSIRPPDLPVDLSSRLPDEGEKFDDGIDYMLAGSSVAVLPAGARALVAPAMLHRCNGGLAVAVEMPGAPEEALRLIDEAEAVDDDDIWLTEGVQDGEEWAAGLITTAGGYYLTLTAVPSRPGHSFVLVNECGD